VKSRRRVNSTVRQFSLEAMKHCLPILLIIFFATSVLAQVNDFPIGISGVPQAKLKGPVKTVLTVEQRADYVFKTIVDSYDRQGRLVESVDSNAHIEVHSGTLVRLGGKIFYFYDLQGRPANAKHYFPDGKFVQLEVFAYDKSGRLTETTYYDSNNNETAKRTYTYSADKREVIATWELHYDGQVRRPSKNLLSYDEENRWTKRTEYDPAGVESAFVTFEYDKRGNFVREVHCCKYNYSHRYEYEFDDHGNWIEQRNIYSQPAAADDPDWMRTYRVITYYSDTENKPVK
jgi:hypothetical protein